MVQLRRSYKEFVKREAEVIVLGPEDKAAFSAFWRERGLPFIGLPDPKHTVLKQFGQQVDLFRMGRMPAQVIIDKQGVVRFVHYGRLMSDIPKIHEILSLLDKLNKDNS